MTDTIYIIDTILIRHLRYTMSVIKLALPKRGITNYAKNIEGLSK